MDNYFSKEILTDRVYSQTTLVEHTKPIDGKELGTKQTSYGFDSDGVPEESTMHGELGEEKSAKAKQLVKCLF